MTHGSVLIVVDDKAIIDNENPDSKDNCKTTLNVIRSNASKISPLLPGYTAAYYQRVNLDSNNFNLVEIPTDAQQLIVCKRQPDFYNDLHEFGHVFVNHFKQFASTQKGKLLSDNMWKLDAGAQEIRVTYDGQVRTPLGFKNEGRFPTRQNLADTLTEEFADTYLNRILDGDPVYPNHGFTDDAAGTARRTEFDEILHDDWFPEMQEYFQFFLKTLE